MRVLATEKGPDGGILPIGSTRQSDVCVNGMFLNFASYFKAEEEKLVSIVDFLLSQRVADGGFNCRSNRQGCVHSSLHSTLSVAEGILEYHRNGYAYRLPELLDAATSAREFILMHRLYKSDKTGAVIDPKMTMLSYPCRWRYDVRRELKRNVEKKTAGDDDTGPCCPVCGRSVGRGWSFCGNCGLLILGSRSIPKRHLIALLIVVLAALSLLAKYLL